MLWKCAEPPCFPHGNAIQIDEGVHFAERTKSLRLLLG